MKFLLIVLGALPLLVFLFVMLSGPAPVVTGWCCIEQIGCERGFEPASCKDGGGSAYAESKTICDFACGSPSMATARSQNP